MSSPDTLEPFLARVAERRDAVVVVTDHDGVDYELVARGVYREARENVVEA